MLNGSSERFKYGKFPKVSAIALGQSMIHQLFYSHLGCSQCSVYFRRSRWLLFLTGRFSIRGLRAFFHNAGLMNAGEGLRGSKTESWFGLRDTAPTNLWDLIILYNFKNTNFALNFQILTFSTSFQFEKFCPWKLSFITQLSSVFHYRFPVPKKQFLKKTQN